MFGVLNTRREDFGVLGLTSYSLVGSYHSGGTVVLYPEKMSYSLRTDAAHSCLLTARVAACNAIMLTSLSEPYISP
jgi:hypothetical protein